MKKQLAQDIINFLAPIQDKIRELSSKEDYLRKIVKLGAEKAQESASKTIKEVRETIGIRSI